MSAFRMADREGMGVNYTEYLVVRGKDSYIRKIKLLVFLGFLAFSGLMFYIMFGLTKIPVLFIVYVVLSVIYFWFFSRYSKIEYEYVLASATFRMEKILAQSHRSLIFEIKIKDMTAIVPYSGNEQLFDGEGVDERHFCASSISSPDLYVGTFTEKGKKIAVLFEATNKALAIFRFYNSGATVVRPVRY